MRATGARGRRARWEQKVTEALLARDAKIREAMRVIQVGVKVLVQDNEFGTAARVDKAARTLSRLARHP